MKKFFILFFALLLPLAVFAATPATHSVEVSVDLQKDGSAIVTETWHITVLSGTEWYTVMDNIGDRQLELIGVSENGVEFINEGDWDVDRSISQKANRCGVIKKRNNSYEICWGIGIYGEHKFVMKYRLTNLVQGFSDYDGFNHMFVSRGISPSPQSVQVTVSAPDTLQFTPENTKIAGFGYRGQCTFFEGKIVAHTTQPFDKECGIIILMQCEKGLFEPELVYDSEFSAVVDKAMEGSDYVDVDGESFEDEESWGEKVLNVVIFIVFALPTLFAIVMAFSFRKLLLYRETGKKMADIPWCRELPYGNDLFATFSLLNKLEQSQDNGIVSALVLQMVQNGALVPHPTGRKDKVEFSFHPEHLTDNPHEKELFSMMQVASGADHILQEKEFKRWSVRHAQRVYKWFENVKVYGENNLNTYVLKKSGNTHSKSEFKKFKQDAATEAIGLKKFLSDTTLIDERRSVEVVLWRDYLIYASLFGIADKVSEELRQFQPQVIDMMERQSYNSVDVVTMLNWSRIISTSINRSVVRAANAQTSVGGWGGGGGASFSGGGGFSGGGFGGGSR